MMEIINAKELKERIDLGEYLQLQGYESSPSGSGNEVRYSCPLNSCGRTFSFNRDKKVGQCFKCHFSGDIFALHAELHGLDTQGDFQGIVGEVAAIVGYEGATKSNMTQRIERSQTVTKNIPQQQTTKVKKRTARTPQQVIETSKPLEQHTYLKKKCIEPCKGLYEGIDEKGNKSIIVPFYTIIGELKSIQFVHEHLKPFCEAFADGDDKKYSAKKAFFTIGEFKDGNTVLIGEGIATVSTCWKALDKKVAAISYGAGWNCQPVINALVNKYPNLKLIHLLDNDKNEAAITKACVFVNNPNVSFRLPCFESFSYELDEKGKAPTDFNDIISKCGQSISVVKEQLTSETPELRKKLMDKYTSITASKKEEVYTAAVEAQKADNAPCSFSEERQETILAYLFQQSFEKIQENGIHPEFINCEIFTDKYRDIFDSITTAWSNGVEPSVAAISCLQSKDAASLFNAAKRIEQRKVIHSSQVNNLMVKLNEDNSKRLLDVSINSFRKNETTFSDGVDRLRVTCDNLLKTRQTVVPLSYETPLLLKDMEDAKLNKLKTGIKSLDRLLGGGFTKAELTTMPGGAGAGKTAFALQIGDNIALHGGTTIYVSVEIGKAKLLERCYKRLFYEKYGQGLKITNREDIANAAKLHQIIAPNVYMVKGSHRMTVSEIRGIVLNVKAQRPDRGVLLIIDPFQRLSSGNDKIDNSTETTKANELCSQIKELAESLKIAVIAVCDTTKGNKDNTTGEGAARGSYMIDHTADHNAMLRKGKTPQSAMYGEHSKGRIENNIDCPFFEEIKKRFFDENGNFKGESQTLENRQIKERYDEYVSLVVSKVRDGGKFNPLFVYRKEHHIFEDTEIWEDIFDEAKKKQD